MGLLFVPLLTICINILNITLIVKSVWYEFCSLVPYLILVAPGVN